MKKHVLLMMGGSGTRLGADRPKQYIEIGGAPVFAYILNKYALMNEIDDIFIVSHMDWVDYVWEWVDKLDLRHKVNIVRGGKSRSESVKNGLRSINIYHGTEGVVLIHDATHPYVDIEGTREIIKQLETYEGVTLGANQYDTVYMTNENDEISSVIPRERVVSGASPEAFNLKRIYDIYDNATEEELEKMTSAGAIALEHGIKMKVVPANVINLKITYRKDMEAFEKMVHTYFFADKEK